MPEPRLRTVNKAKPPYMLNCFPREFLTRFAEEAIVLMATKDPFSLEGEEWEKMFAFCIGAEWQPSNVGLDDVVLGNCCWSAKTVKSAAKDMSAQKEVRLISGRNSPAYSYGESVFTSAADPALIGEQVLDIWNERVSGVRQIFKFARTVVLVKGRELGEFLLFETDTVRRDPELYSFEWNARGNLEGRRRSDGRHCFTWQPHGSQFTIIEEIPEDRLHLKVKVPGRIDRREILSSVGYDESRADDWLARLP